MTPRKAGFEAGVQRQLPHHSYSPGSMPAREFMAGFEAGRKHRAWLDDRGQRRTRILVERDAAGGWRWEFKIENTLHSKGQQRSEKAASQAAEAAAAEAAEAGLTRVGSDPVPA